MIPPIGAAMVITSLPGAMVSGILVAEVLLLFSELYMTEVEEDAYAAEHGQKSILIEIYTCIIYYNRNSVLVIYLLMILTSLF